MRFCIKTLGCKVNQYEAQAIESILRDRGHISVPLGEGNDICILNTCAVTSESERKSRQLIRKMKRLEPNALIAVCGCYSQLDPSVFSGLGVDFVSGVYDRHAFALKVEEHVKQGTQVNTPSLSPCVLEELPPGNTTNRTRALLKIQDGCDNFCTYCIVPYIRGRSRSLPLERVAEYAKQLEEQGYKEIIITGIEISSVSPCLITAIQTISTAAPDTRLRFGSLDPAIVTEEFCKNLSKIPNICNHIHLSLQSGCDSTLQRMGRKYSTNQALKSIEAVRKYFKNCGVTADLITGFPGETEDEFEQTLEFIKKAAFSDMHIFPYSMRPGTKAAKLTGQIDKSIKKERARIAIETAQEMADIFKRAQIGKTVEVLFEQYKNGISTGHSSNYLEINVKGKAERNTIRSVKVATLQKDKLYGNMENIYK